MYNKQISKSITDRSTISSYLKDITKYPVLSTEEELKQVDLAKQGDGRAVNKLIESNLKFVVSIAKQYQGHGVPLEDLIEEGNLGLIRSIQSYNPDKGTKLISYAVWWIRQSIMHYLTNKSRIIRLSNSVVSTKFKIKRAIREFEQKYERTPSTSELSTLTDISEDKIDKILNSSQNTVSLNLKLNDEDDSRLIDIIPNDEKDADSDTINNNIYSKLYTALGRLKQRERNIIINYYGLDGIELNLIELSKRYNLSPERIRQIKEKGLKKLYNWLK